MNEIVKEYIEGAVKITHPSKVVVIETKQEIINKVNAMVNEITSWQNSILEAMKDIEEIDKIGVK